MKNSYETARSFYAEEYIKSAWSVRHPERQIRIDEFQLLNDGEEE